jgi:hypothetical protein
MIVYFADAQSRVLLEFIDFLPIVQCLSQLPTRYIYARVCRIRLELNRAMPLRARICKLELNRAVTVCPCPSPNYLCPRAVYEQYAAR